MNRDEKEQEIQKLNAEFQKAKNLFVAGFQGLTVAQDFRVEAERSSDGLEVQGREEYVGAKGVGRNIGGALER